MTKKAWPQLLMCCCCGVLTGRSLHRDPFHRSVQQSPSTIVATVHMHEHNAECCFVYQQGMLRAVRREKVS